MLRIKKTILLALLGLVVIVSGCASNSTSDEPEEASNYPSGDIKALVAASTGGGTDNFARQVQSPLMENLDTNITVENFKKASGAMAFRNAADSDPDGLTLAFGSTIYLTTLAAGVNETGLDELTPVCRMQSDIFNLIVNPDKYEDADDFFDNAKEHPGEMNIGGVYAASPDAAVFYQLEEESGLDLSFVPYESDGELTSDILSGDVDAMINKISSTVDYLDSGEMKSILVFTEEPLDKYPEIPTAKDYGWDITDGNERGVFVNADTPEDIIKKIEKEFKAVYDSEEYQKYAEEHTLDYREGWMNGEEYREKLEKDLEKYKKYFEN